MFVHDLNVCHFLSHGSSVENESSNVSSLLCLSTEQARFLSKYARK